MKIPDRNNLRNRRMELGVSQKKMAKMCGILASALNQYEKGSQELSHKKWAVLVDAIDRMELEEIKKEEEKTLGEICNRKIKAVSKFDSLQKALDVMNKDDFNQLLVSEKIEGKKEYIGIIFDNDICTNWTNQKKRRVLDVMTHVSRYDENYVVTPEFYRLLAKDRCILVSKNNKVVGMVTISDVLN